MLTLFALTCVSLVATSCQDRTNSTYNNSGDSVIGIATEGNYVVNRDPGFNEMTEKDVISGENTISPEPTPSNAVINVEF